MSSGVKEHEAIDYFEKELKKKEGLFGTLESNEAIRLAIEALQSVY